MQKPTGRSRTPGRVDHNATVITGSIIEAKVTRVERDRKFAVLSFGNGCTGKLHESEIGLGDRATKEARFAALEKDQVLVVKVIDVVLPSASGKPWTSVTLSVKALERQAHEQARDAELSNLVGNVVIGTVVSKEPFGVFVQVGEYTRGLLHVSEINCDRPRQRDERLANDLNVGVEVTVLVSTRKKGVETVVSLSEKQAAQLLRQQEEAAEEAVDDAEQGEPTEVMTDDAGEATDTEADQRAAQAQVLDTLRKSILPTLQPGQVISVAVLEDMGWSETPGIMAEHEGCVFCFIPDSELNLGAGEDRETALAKGVVMDVKITGFDEDLVMATRSL